MNNNSNIQFEIVENSIDLLENIFVTCKVDIVDRRLSKE
jgi:hypothetical protein